jgi:CheY-like chemotaxis protein
VVVLSNAYLGELAEKATALGAQGALPKSGCTPARLAKYLSEVLGREFASSAPLSPPPASSPQSSTEESQKPPTTASSKQAQAAPEPAAGESAAHQAFKAQARQDFLKNSDATRAALRQLFKEFSEARNDRERSLRLESLYRKLHFLSATAGMADCHLEAQMATVLEALLFQMADQPARIGPSVMRTTGLAFDFLDDLFELDASPRVLPPPTARVLVVDDDELSNRLVVAALRRVQLEAESTTHPLTGLDWLQQKGYDLVVLDVMLPEIDGFEFFVRMRALRDYERTPVIYVTSLVDFEAAAKGELPDGAGLLAKPVLATELAVMVVMHLIKSRLWTSPPPEQP